jgi:hypothetical protein
VTSHRCVRCATLCNPTLGVSARIHSASTKTLPHACHHCGLSWQLVGDAPRNAPQVASNGVGNPITISQYASRVDSLVQSNASQSLVCFSRPLVSTLPPAHRFNAQHGLDNSGNCDGDRCDDETERRRRFEADCNGSLDEGRCAAGRLVVGNLELECYLLAKVDDGTGVAFCEFRNASALSALQLRRTDVERLVGLLISDESAAEAIFAARTGLVLASGNDHGVVSTAAVEALNARLRESETEGAAFAIDARVVHSKNVAAKAALPRLAGISFTSRHPASSSSSSSASSSSSSSSFLSLPTSSSSITSSLVAELTRVSRLMIGAGPAAVEVNTETRPATWLAATRVNVRAPARVVARDLLNQLQPNGSPSA